MKVFITILTSILCINFILAQSIRKNYTDMPTPERTAYINVLLSLKANAPGSQFNPLSYGGGINGIPNDDIIEFFATLHADPDQDGILGNMNMSMPGAPDSDSPIHGVEDFLPWHRQFLIEFEKQLKRGDYGNPWLSIPYWDWRYFGRQGTGSSDASSQLLWDNNQGFLGVFGTGGTNNWGLGRTLSGTLPSVSQVSTTQSISNFTTYRDALEFGNSANGNANIHGWPHVYVGGWMSDILVSPRDPIFYLHHGMIDYLWQLWEEDPGKASSFSNNTMPTFSGSVTGFPNVSVASIIDTRQRGVFYADHQTQTANMNNYTVASSAGQEEFFYYQYNITAGTNFIVPANTMVSIMSCSNIRLLPGFEARFGSRLKASINSNCNTFFPNASNNSGGRLAAHNKNKEAIISFESPNLSYEQSYRTAGELSSNQTAFKAYPVPATGIITIEYSLSTQSEVTISLYDYTGHQIKNLTQENVKEPGIHLQELDLSGLIKGVYLLQLRTRFDIRGIKIFKQ